MRHPPIEGKPSKIPLWLISVLGVLLVHGLLSAEISIADLSLVVRVASTVARIPVVILGARGAAEADAGIARSWQTIIVATRIWGISPFDDERGVVEHVGSVGAIIVVAGEITIGVAIAEAEVALVVGRILGIHAIPPGDSAVKRGHATSC
jgi:hypothetical protein